MNVASLEPQPATAFIAIINKPVSKTNGHVNAVIT